MVRRAGWLAAVLMLVWLAGAAGAKGTTAESCEPGSAPGVPPPEESGSLTVRLAITGGDTDGRMCAYRDKGPLIGARYGPFAGNSHYVYQWNVAPDTYNASFEITGSPTTASGTMFVNLTTCKDADGIVYLNVSHVPGLTASFSGSSRCTYGPAENSTVPPNETAPSGGSGPGDDNETGADAGSDNESASRDSTDRNPPDGSGEGDDVGESGPPTDAVAGGGHSARNGAQGSDDGWGLFSIGGEPVPLPPEAITLGVVASSSILVGVALVRYGPGLLFGAASLLGRRLVASAEEHPIRERVLDLVRSEPGIHANAVRRRLELGSGQVMHHLGILVNHRLLESMGRGGFRRFFPARRYGTQDKRAIASLRRRHALAVYEALARRPGIPLKSVAREVELSPSTVTKVVKILGRADVVEGDSRRGTLKARDLSPAVRNALISNG